MSDRRLKLLMLSCYTISKQWRAPFDAVERKCSRRKGFESLRRWTGKVREGGGKEGFEKGRV